MLTALVHHPYERDPTGASAEITGFASKGELLSLAFSLHSRTSSPELSLELSALYAHSGHQLHGELYVVHRWLQSGLGLTQSRPVEVDELLLKDDRMPLRDGYRRRCASWAHIHRTPSRYLPPDVRVTGAVNTAIGTGATKQFWISLQVPADSPSGAYSGVVTVRGAGVSLELPVKVDVLPITLAEAPQDLMIWYRGTINCHHPHHYVSPRVFRTQLDDIYAHGFRSISISETDSTLMQRAVDEATAAGFARNVVLDEYREEIWRNVDFGRLTPLVYVSDEPDGISKEPIDVHVERSRRMRELGVSTMASVLHWKTRHELKGAGRSLPEPDVVSVYAPANLPQLQVSGSLNGSSSSRTWYYWQAHMEKPIVHRLLAGLLLWKSGAGGISPYCYQHLPGAPYSAFDDFDPWDPRERRPADGSRFRDHLATYPARRGVIPTIQWKGMADGLTDLRYLHTLEEALSRNEDRPGLVSADISKRLRLIEKIRWLDLDLLSDSRAMPCEGIGPGDFRQMRETLAGDLMTLAATT